MPPCGGHLKVDPETGAIIGFKSCPRVGGIAYHNQHKAKQEGFKSCPRVGGIGIRGLFCAGGRSFKSCPRVGGIRRGKHRGALVGKVSSRAPVWGASPTSPPSRFSRSVSSRAPVWGASCNAASISIGIFSFQVVPPCGGHLKVAFPECSLKGFKSCPRVGGILR